MKSKRCVVDETAKAKRCDVHWWCHQAGCGSSGGVFYHTDDAAERLWAPRCAKVGGVGRGGEGWPGLIVVGCRLRVVPPCF